MRGLKTQNLKIFPEAKSCHKDIIFDEIEPKDFKIFRTWLKIFLKRNTVHPPICQLFISRKSVDKSGFVDKSGES